MTSDSFPLMGDAIDFLLLLWAVDHDLQQKSIAMQRDIGVTGPQRLVIRIVGRFPGISPGQVAGLLGAHPSTATGLTQRLLRRGLLLARPDPHDARRIRLALSAKGRGIERASVGTIEQAVGELLAGSSRSEVAATRTVLERLREILRKATGPASNGPYQGARAGAGRASGRGSTP